MPAKRSRRSEFSVFVRFRGSRLLLRRGIRSFAEASVIAEELRANRFHDREAIFIQRSEDLPAARARAPEPAALPAPASLASRAMTLAERLEHVRLLKERALASRERFERACQAAEDALEHRGTEALERVRDRLAALGAQIEKAESALARADERIARRRFWVQAEPEASRRKAFAHRFRVLQAARRCGLLP